MTVTKEVVNVWDSMSWDVLVIQRTNAELDERAGEILAATGGVDALHPTLVDALEVDRDPYESRGIPPDTPMFEPETLGGRWLEPGDDGKPVAVFGQALAATAGLDVGDVVAVGTGSRHRRAGGRRHRRRAREQRNHGLLAAHHVPAAAWPATTPTRSG